MLTQLCMHQIESSIESLTRCHPACMRESTCRFTSQLMHTCVQDLIPVDDDDEILATMLKQAAQQQEEEHQQEEEQQQEEEGEEEQEQEEQE